MTLSTSVRASLGPRHRLRAAGWHLLASAAVASAAAAVVFGVWFRPPLHLLAGGLSLFLLLVSVDVVIGPALTAVAASPLKPAAEFRRDVAVIVALQLSAFCYGVYTMALARPVHLSFEVDRVRVVTAADIDPAKLGEAPPALRALPWTGPVWTATAKPTDEKTLLKSIDLGLSGMDLSMQPDRWRPYDDDQRRAAWNAARPLTRLTAQYPAAQAKIAAAVAASGQPAEALRFLPLQSRHASAVMLLAGPDARPVGTLMLDGFF